MQARPSFSWINPSTQLPQDGTVVKVKHGELVSLGKILNRIWLSREGKPINQPDAWQVTL